MIETGRLLLSLVTQSKERIRTEHLENKDSKHTKKNISREGSKGSTFVDKLKERNMEVYKVYDTTNTNLLQPDNETTP